ncbi:acylneuraminate cytidylyltransferase family protein [Shewanella gaetbuli]|uniref:Acylneuraminate cytidylyltransferase family protein n=1 Tax=Shewanella gaetbuli TaxID=220752 RepID=A0A9X1ZKY6_9GAMM|nr:acylneuraminate cytidylyltransferase family protein [Shewanella gaetbuli]MCL1141720.1 acylneuraminate cytidylyltransferase family protein [Shewanella gaetbuli]
MKVYGFIFARGGSKGLPKKNIKPLCGKPLIKYAIDCALATPMIDAVFVSTEDAEIAQISKDAGAIVIDRPAELASDTCAEWLSWQHACQWVLRHYGEFDYFVSLPATSPLRHVDDIVASVDALSTPNEMTFDACISVTPANRSPFFNMVTRDADGEVNIVNQHQGLFARRQDVPDVYDITTVVYSTTPSYVLTHDNLFAGKLTSIEVPKARAIDIDDIYDFLLAEAILQHQGDELC